MKFGEYLQSKEIATLAEVEDALAAQRYRPERIGRILRDLGFIEQSTLNSSLYGFLGVRSAEPLDIILKNMEELLAPVDVRSWLAKRGAVATSLIGGIVYTYSLNFDDALIESFEKVFGAKLKLLVVDPRIYDFLKSKCSAGLDFEPSNHLTLSHKISDDQKIEVNNPYIRLFFECIETAKKGNISDVHVEPKKESIELRFRIHGDLVTWKTLGIEHRDAFIDKVKWLTNLDLSVSGKPQDSRATYYKFKLNLRVNALPSRHGDKIVLRLLDQERDFSLDDSGLDETTLFELKKAVEFKNGLVIVSGPTGSGKTTTLYGLINSLDSQSKNITTLEDPSEYELPGVTQTEISSQLDFASALRALMRQDPDVILVGEIRDEETAKLSFKIANTGHLVISTLHANGALESIERLRNLGIDDFSLSNSLRFVGAQRLVKKLCGKCSLSADGGVYMSENTILQEFASIDGIPLDFRTRNMEGCELCLKGISGRIPVLEYADSAGVNRYIGDSNKVSCLKVSLQRAAFRLAARGLVDLEEVINVA